MQRLVLIDGNAILHRAYHALPDLTTSKGELVNAVFGFISMILKVRDELSPSHFAVTFDLPKPTFRKKMFAGYQAKRPKMADELAGQIKRVKEVVKTMGIPIYEKAGFEADDVIGTLAYQTQNSKLKTQNLETIIVTGDRDLLQLVNGQTKVYMLLRGLTEATLYDQAKVKEKIGLEPSQIPDYKALIGDQADNYPGVSGIGPKTATRLLQEYGTLENLYKCLTRSAPLRGSRIASLPLAKKTLEQVYKKIEAVESGLREKLLKGKEDAQLSQKLATIILDVSVKLDLEKCQMDNFAKPEVRKLFEELEFRTLTPRLSGRPVQKTVKKEEKQKEEQISLF